MGVLRRVIFPALRIGIWAVIAAALLLIAFRPAGSGGADGTDQIEPWADFSPSLITPVRGDVQNKVTLNGTVVPDTSREVKATTAGTVHQVWVGTGDDVDNGAPVITLRTLLGDGDDENFFRTVPVVSTATGMVTVTVGLGDEVAVGDVVAKVFPGSYTVEADVEPLQMYQLQNTPSVARATITGGPGEFECKTFTTKVVMDDEGSGTRATCFVPADALVFPGVGVSLELVTDSAEDVLLLPVTAVEGTIGVGKVWSQDDSGDLIEVDVTLGLSDGKFVEITGGLDEGDEVLEFVPSQQDAPWDGGWEEFEEGWVEEGFIEEEMVEGDVLEGDEG